LSLIHKLAETTTSHLSTALLSNFSHKRGMRINQIVDCRLPIVDLGTRILKTLAFIAGFKDKSKIKV
jgi:hypothetical protein